MDFFVATVASLLCVLFIAWWLWRLAREGLQAIGIAIPSPYPLSRIFLRPMAWVFDRVCDVCWWISDYWKGRSSSFSEHFKDTIATHSKKKVLESWWEPMGPPRTYSIPVQNGAHQVVLESQLCRGCEYLGRLFVDGKPIAMNWERFDSRCGNLRSHTEHFVWPEDSLEFPCTGLTELLIDSEKDPGVDAPCLVAADGNLHLAGMNVTVLEGLHDVVYAARDVEVTVSLNDGRGHYVHHKSVDFSQ